MIRGRRVPDCVVTRESGNLGEVIDDGSVCHAFGGRRAGDDEEREASERGMDELERPLRDRVAFARAEGEREAFALVRQCFGGARLRLKVEDLDERRIERDALAARDAEGRVQIRREGVAREIKGRIDLRLVRNGEWALTLRAPLLLTKDEPGRTQVQTGEQCGDRPRTQETATRNIHLSLNSPSEVPS